MQDSSCKWNERDHYCHPTFCGIKLRLQQRHMNNLENAGFQDLANYIDSMDICCNKCKGCGYEKRNYSIKFNENLDSYLHSEGMILPEPLDSYVFAKELKRKFLIERKEKYLKMLEDIAKDFKEEFGEDINEVC